MFAFIEWFHRMELSTAHCRTVYAQLVNMSVGEWVLGSSILWTYGILWLHHFHHVLGFDRFAAWSCWIPGACWKVALPSLARPGPGLQTWEAGLGAVIASGTMWTWKAWNLRSLKLSPQVNEIYSSENNPNIPGSWAQWRVLGVPSWKADHCSKLHHDRHKGEEHLCGRTQAQCANQSIELNSLRPPEVSGTVEQWNSSSTIRNDTFSIFFPSSPVLLLHPPAQVSKYEGKQLPNYHHQKTMEKQQVAASISQTATLTNGNLDLIQLHSLGIECHSSVPCIQLELVLLNDAKSNESFHNSMTSNYDTCL